jgi:hypothetical protein
MRVPSWTKVTRSRGSAAISCAVLLAVAALSGIDARGWADVDPADVSLYSTNQTASLGDFVWHDVDGDGIQGADEPGIGGVTVTLYVPDGGCQSDAAVQAADSVAGVATTTPDGAYAFTGLAPGCYYVQVSLPAGYRFSPQDQGPDDARDSDIEPVTSLTPVFNLAPGYHDPDLDAGLQPDLLAAKYHSPSQVRATYRFWYYIHITNPTDQPFTQIAVTDTLPFGIAPYSVLASAGGSFDGVDTVTWYLDTLDPHGSTFVSIRAQTYSSAAGSYISNRAWIDAAELGTPIPLMDTAWVHYPPAPPTSTPTQTATPTSTPTSTSTATPSPTPTGTATPSTGSILACAWNDLNANGERDLGEPPLPGVVMDLQNGEGVFVDSCTTDAGGCCTFGDLPPGSYAVAAGGVHGFFFTTVPTAEVDVLAGQVSEVHFGSRQWYVVVLPVVLKNTAR